MKLGYVIALIMIPAVTPALAALPITPNQALANQGNNVVVRGPAFVHPSPAPMDGMEVAIAQGGMSVHAYIPRDNLYRFRDLRALNGRIVDISGVVESDRGEPEIRVTSPDQIAIVR